MISKFISISALFLIFLLTICIGCGTEDCPIDCEEKYKCVDRGESCEAMKEQCENFFFRKCMRCACPKTCGVCGESSSENVEEETTSTTTNTTTNTNSISYSSSSTFTSSSSPSPSPSTSSQSTTPKSTSSIPYSTPRILFTTNMTKRYPAAKIKYCDCNLWQFPEIKDFIHALDTKSGDGSEYANQVSPQYVAGIHPTLVLMEANGMEAKSIQIGGWSIKKIKTYLDDNLAKMAPTANGANKNNKNGGGNERTKKLV